MQKIVQFWKSSAVGKIVIIAGLLMLACCCCTAFFMVYTTSPTYRATATAQAVIEATELAKPTNTPLPTKTPKPTNTLRPTNTPKPTNTPRPTNPPSPTEISPYIPGVSPVDIQLNLRRNDFDCGAVEPGEYEGETFYTWTCERDDAGIQYIVMFTSRNLDTVDYINASILQFGSPSNEVTKSFLGFVATIAFIGSEDDQVQAKTWVEETLPKLTGEAGDVHSTTINGISMQLAGPDTGRFLRMGDLR
jgi:hypothetical protein